MNTECNCKLHSSVTFFIGPPHPPGIQAPQKGYAAVIIAGVQPLCNLDGDHRCCVPTMSERRVLQHPHEDQVCLGTKPTTLSLLTLSRCHWVTLSRCHWVHDDVMHSVRSVRVWLSQTASHAIACSPSWDLTVLTLADGHC